MTKPLSRFNQIMIKRWFDYFKRTGDRDFFRKEQRRLIMTPDKIREELKDA